MGDPVEAPTQWGLMRIDVCSLIPVKFEFVTFRSQGSNLTVMLRLTLLEAQGLKNSISCMLRLVSTLKLFPPVHSAIFNILIFNVHIIVMYTFLLYNEV